VVLNEVLCEDRGGKRRRDHFRRVVVPMLKSPSRSSQPSPHSAGSSSHSGPNPRAYSKSGSGPTCPCSGRNVRPTCPLHGSRAAIGGQGGLASGSHLSVLHSGGVHSSLRQGGQGGRGTQAASHGPGAKAAPSCSCFGCQRPRCSRPGGHGFFTHCGDSCRFGQCNHGNSSSQGGGGSGVGGLGYSQQGRGGGSGGVRY
jgi:hypothetical protein